MRIYRKTAGRTARLGVWLATMVAAGVLAACGSRVHVPPAQPDPAAEARQQAAFVAAMKPRREGRPVVAVVALNDATETTDFLLTHAVMQRSGLVDVRAVAPRAGRVSLYPALQVDGAQDFAGFDAAFPAGADYVIVPALSNDNDPAITAWLRQQADKGARVIGVCVGVLVVGRAGLLDGRRFVTHWFVREDVLERHPTAVYVPHQRYVVDRNVATTTGITASVPTMLALVEAIGGRDKAAALASELGVGAWTPAHDSTAFGLNVTRGFHYLVNKAAFWRDETAQLETTDGVDDIALAFAADAWARTGRVTIDAAATGPVKLRSGLTLVASPPRPDARTVTLTAGLKPVQQLDRTLCEIGERFGEARREWVTMELEYPANPDACRR